MKCRREAILTRAMWCFTLLVLQPGLLMAQPAGSVADLKNLSLEELSNVEVTTANKQPEPALDTAAALYVITSDDIRRSGATTLPDALRLAPGVIVSQSDGNRWAVGIRGFADLFSKSLLVLIDGRSVYTPLVGGVHWAIQDVVLADVDRIEVIRGPGGGVWGANAVNGVINVITKASDATRGLQVTAATGNIEHARLEARFGGKAGPADYRVYGKAFTRGGQFHEDGTAFDTWEAGQIGVRSDWKAGARDALTISADIYRTVVGERAQVSGFTPPSVRDVDGIIRLSGGNVRGAWERTFDRGARSEIQVYYDVTDRDGFTFGETRHTWNLDANYRAASIGRHQLSFGTSGRLSPSTTAEVVPTLRFIPARHTSRVFNAFVSDDVTLVPERLSAGIGLRVEYNDFTGAELLPSVKAQWTPGPKQRVWAGVTRAVRTPSRFERDLLFELLIDPAAPLYVAVQGRDDFGNESVLGSEAGYRRVFGSNFYFDVVAFHNRYDDLQGFGNPSISPRSDPIPHLALELPFANAIEGSSRGIEVAADWKPLPTWRLAGSYGYLRLDLANKPQFTNLTALNNYGGLAPPHQVRVQSRIDLGRQVQFDQTYRYVARLEGPGVPSYQGLDARLGWSPSLSMELSIVGQNLTDARHAEFGAVPVEIRRSAYVQLTIRRPG